MKQAIVLAVVVFLYALPARSAVIFETAAYAQTQNGGSIISFEQFLGARFHLDNAVEVTGIGGLMSGLDTEGNFFGAIISLENPSAFPVGNPFDVSEVIASTLFTLTLGPQDCLFPLSTQLSPGDYALIFGSDELGASGGLGAMPSLGMTNLPGTLDKMYWQPDNSQWINITLPFRFVVEGTVVPEPGTLLMLGLGGLILQRKR